MPVNDCGYCQQLIECGAYFQSSDEFQKIATQLLCEIADNTVPVSKVLYDWEILCTPTTNIPIAVRFKYNDDGTGIIVAAFNINGTPYGGSISALVYCSGGNPQADHEVQEQTFCDNGVEKTRVRFYTNGVISSTIWIDVLGVATTAPASAVGVQFGACVTAATTSNVTPTRTNATSNGSTAAGLQGVSFTNVGTTNGTVASVAILPGETVTFNGYLDPVGNVYKRLAAIAYTASGTAILHISAVP